MNNHSSIGPWLAVAWAAAALAAPATALALPGSSVIIDQNRADRRPPAPKAEPPAPRTVAAHAAPIAVTPFLLREVRLEQGTVSPTLLAPAWGPFIGATVDGAALNRLTDAVAAAYGKTDVALYTIELPNQDFADGVARLRVTEGYIAAIDVQDQGGARRSLARVRAIAGQLLGEHPLRRSSFQRAILLIRDIPGLTADIQLLQGDRPGAVRLAIAVKQKPFEIGAGINNRGTAELGTTQVEADLTANGLLRASDQTRFTVVLPTDTRLFQYYALSQSEPIGDDGLTIAGNIGYLATHPTIVPLQGSAEIVGVSLSYPLIRTTPQTLTLTGALDGVNSDDALLGQAISNDHTRALRAAAAYSATLGKVTVAASGTASFGLDILGARVTSPLLSDPTFKKLNLRAGVDDAFTPQWTLRLRAIGQYSGDRLPAVEQMALGGDEFGRAFPSAVIIGDSGMAGSAELAYAPPIVPVAFKGSELYSFVDGGQLWVQDRVILPGQTLSLSSAGFGARLAFAAKSAFQIEADKPLDAPATDPGRDWRVVFGVRTLY